MRKYDLITRYLQEEKNTGTASRLSLQEYNNDSVIVGYGWAIYVMKFKGRHLLFGDGYATKKTNVGWAGYSGQTTQHMQEIKGMLEENGESYTVVDYQMRVGELNNLSDREIEEIVSENRVEKCDGNGYTVTLTR